MVQRTITMVIALGFLAAACGGSGSGTNPRTGMRSSMDEESSPGDTSTRDSESEESTIDLEVSLAGSIAEPLALCPGSAAAVDITAATDIAYELDGSIHELVACGGLTFSFTLALVEGVVSLIANAGGDGPPDGFEYREDGSYYTESDTGLSQVEMAISFWVDEDGELRRIEDNLFDIDTYLVGAEVSGGADIDIDWNDPFAASVSVDAELTYDAAGPWVSLLGLGDPPPNPIALADVADLSPGFDDLIVIADVHYAQERDGVLVEYDVVTTPLHVGPFLAGDGLDFEVLQLHAEHATLDQELTIGADEFQIEYGSRALDGTVAFEIDSGPLPFSGVLFYDQSAYAEIELACR